MVITTYRLRFGVLIPIKQRILHVSIIEKIIEQIHGHFGCIAGINLVEASSLNYGHGVRSVLGETPGHGQTGSSTADNDIVKGLARPAIGAEMGTEQVFRLDPAVQLSSFIRVAVEKSTERREGSKGAGQKGLWQSSHDTNDWNSSHGGNESPSA